MTFEPFASASREVDTPFGDGEGSQFEGISDLPAITRQPAYSTVTLEAPAPGSITGSFKTPALPAIASGPVLDSWEYTPQGGSPVTVDLEYQNADNV